MKDGHTRKIDRSEIRGELFLTRFRASLIVVEGGAAGSEYILDAPSYTMGRGPGVDIEFADDAMSKTHAALEVSKDGFRIRDMGSTNGLSVNGSVVAVADLKHADRIRLGEHILQYIVEPRERVGTVDLSRGR